ncbi:MAG: glycosyltransferase family 39 protein, partial [Caldilineaceae bacterium]|nr:glycosyltransferase family 39 protein [Caldilineaceae bacterium]
MLWLTANDIHPPLYYALLHLWTVTLAGTGPLLARLFSLFSSVPALLLLALLAQTLFPQRPRLVLLATLLLVINPLHLFYSQEVRMYGLAMTITLASSLAFWRTFMSVGGRWRSWWLAYIVLATAALYTLYYCAFLLLAHLLWAIWYARRQWRALRVVLLTYLTIALLYTPWVVYTATNL